MVAATAVLCGDAILAVSLTSDKTYDAGHHGSSSGTRDWAAPLPAAHRCSRPPPIRNGRRRRTRSSSAPSGVAQMVVDDLSLDETAEDLLDSDDDLGRGEHRHRRHRGRPRRIPRKAAAVANSFADSYVSYSRKSDREKVKQAERLLSERIQDTPDKDPRSGPISRMRCARWCCSSRSRPVTPR